MNPVNDLLGSFYKQRKRAIIVRYSSLGDVVFDMHKVQEIKRRIPDWDLTWLVRETYAPLIRRLAFVDNVLIWENDSRLGSFMRLVTTVRSARFDVFLGLQTNDMTASLAILSGIPIKIGFHRTFQFLFDQDIYWWLGALGIPHFNSRSAPLGTHGNSGSGKRFHSIRQTVFAVIGASHPRKQWPEESWRRFIELTTTNGISVALVGSGGKEAALAARLSAGMSSDQVLNFVDRLDVSEIPLLAENCSVAVGGDTGPTHIAVAAGVFRQFSCSVRRT